MKEKAKVLTILSGIITILLGIFICGLSVFVLLASFSTTDTNIIVGIITFGVSIVIQMILAIIIFAVGITVIVIGGLEVRLGTRTNYEYASRKGSVIGYCIFNGILILLSAVGIFFTTSHEILLTIFIVLTSVFALCFILKIIDYALFKKKVNKGLISLKRNSTEKVDLKLLDNQEVIKEAPAQEKEKVEKPILEEEKNIETDTIEENSSEEQILDNINENNETDTKK